MKKILVTGCNGLVGKFLIEKLLRQQGDNLYLVIGADIKESDIKLNDLYKHRFKYEKVDLTNELDLIGLFDRHNPDVVINAFGIKGSPIRAKTQPVDFLYPSFKINTEIINQCSKRNIWLVFMSSVGVYSPAETFVESDVWKTLPSEHDWFPSWSKRMGEILLEAYKVQYGYDKWSIIRPANIYGDYDDFSGNGTVISSTVKKIWESDGSIECWGDGSPIRDFVYGGDVADACIKLFEDEINDVVNFGAGVEITIKSMIESLVKISGKDLSINWDTSKPNGDLKRQMDVTKQKSYDLLPKKSFEDGLRNTYNYYISQFDNPNLNFKVKDFIDTGYYFGKIEEMGVNIDEFNKHIIPVIKSAETKEDYLYRYEYKNFSQFGGDYKPSITKDEIEERNQFIKDNNLDVVQKWWESVKFTGDLSTSKDYFKKVVEDYVVKIYPELKDNIEHQMAFTIYEDGDHITPHNDGENRARKCVILIYLSDEKDYINGGGELVVMEDGDVKSLIPIKGNFSMLDFTHNNPNHAVNPVKNGFRRLTFIDFIFDKKELKKQ
jgi:GDP-L-fucose synthase